MNFLNILFILIVTMLCSDLCAALFLPLLKSLKSKLLYDSYAPSYGYRNPYGGYGYRAGFYGGPSYGNYPRRYRGGRKRTGRTYSDIARVINPNPYAFVGKQPYPAQPFYPRG
ncbi:uncharacterized protein ACRADG_013324 [Cochliomyia hominivorax]